MDQIIKELEDLEEEIKEAETELNRKQGELDAKMSDLEKEFDVDSLDKAKNLRAKLEDQLLDMETEIQSDFKKLKEDYEF